MSSCELVAQRQDLLQPRSQGSASAAAVGRPSKRDHKLATHPETRSECDQQCKELESTEDHPKDANDLGEGGEEGKSAGGARHAEVAGATLLEIIAALDVLYPGIEARIRHGEKISPTVALIVDGKIAAQGLATCVKPDSQIDILPAFGGG